MKPKNYSLIKNFVWVKAQKSTGSKLAVCPKVKKAVDYQRVKCKELSDEKTKNTEKHNTVSMQKSEDIEGDEKEQQEKSSQYMSG